MHPLVERQIVKHLNQECKEYGLSKQTLKKQVKENNRFSSPVLCFYRRNFILF